MVFGFFPFMHIEGMCPSMNIPIEVWGCKLLDYVPALELGIFFMFLHVEVYVLGNQRFNIVHLKVLAISPALHLHSAFIQSNFLEKTLRVYITGILQSPLSPFTNRKSFGGRSKLEQYKFCWSKGDAAILFCCWVNLFTRNTLKLAWN